MPAHRNELHHFWKGEDAGYSSRHYWVYRRLGKALKCEQCGTDEGRIEWANISGQYLRATTDYRSLCKPCHRRFDAPRWGSAKARFAPTESHPALSGAGKMR